MDMFLEAWREPFGEQRAFICRHIVEKLAEYFSHQRLAYQAHGRKEACEGDTWPQVNAMPIRRGKVKTPALSKNTPAFAQE